MFEPFKKALGDEQFETYDQVETFEFNWLVPHAVSFYENGIKKTTAYLKKSVRKGGYYIEKEFVKM